MPPTTPHNHDLIQRGADLLNSKAGSLIATLSDEEAAAKRGVQSALELVVDGYAHVLALEVDRRRLKREIAYLAESGDPDVAGLLSELAVSLRCTTQASEELRDRLSAFRARVEAGGEERP